MEFNIAEISEWERDLYEKNLVKVYGNKSDRPFLKKSKSKYRVNNNRPTYWWVKECPKARKLYQRSFRRRMKRNIYDENYYHIRARDYKTYGYLTW